MIKKKFVKLLSLFLLSKDWWYLFNKAKLKGVDSCWDYACRIKLRLQGSYIGHSASFESKPCFPHGVTGCFISGGVYWCKLRHISTGNYWKQYSF